MRQKIRRGVTAVLVGGCVGGLPAPVRAQTDTAESRSVEVRLGVGGTRGALSSSGDLLQPIGLLGMHWSRSRSALSGRLELTYEEESSTNRTAGGFDCAGCASQSGHRLTGLQISGQLDLARGTLRPYLLSGVGIYRSASRYRVNFTCTDGADPWPTCAPDDAWRSFGTAREAVLGLHSGAGLSVTVGRATIFAEGRLLLLSRGMLGRGSRIPLLLGVRF